MNTMEIAKLKERTKNEMAETMREYDSWIKQARFFSNWVLWTACILAAGALVYYNRDGNIGWGIGSLYILFTVSLAILFRRNGHSEGYLEGHNDGFGEGIDKALGLDEEAQKKLMDLKKDISDLY